LHGDSASGGMNKQFFCGTAAIYIQRYEIASAFIGLTFSKDDTGFTCRIGFGRKELDRPAQVVSDECRHRVLSAG